MKGTCFSDHRAISYFPLTGEKTAKILYYLHFCIVLTIDAAIFAWQKAVLTQTYFLPINWEKPG